jgi:lysozyme family protein
MILLKLNKFLIYIYIYIINVSIPVSKKFKIKIKTKNINILKLKNTYNLIYNLKQIYLYFFVLIFYLEVFLFFNEI